MIKNSPYAFIAAAVFISHSVFAQSSGAPPQSGPAITGPAIAGPVGQPEVNQAVRPGKEFAEGRRATWQQGMQSDARGDGRSHSSRYRGNANAQAPATTVIDNRLFGSGNYINAPVGNTTGDFNYAPSNTNKVVVHPPTQQAVVQASPQQAGSVQPQTSTGPTLADSQMAAVAEAAKARECAAKSKKGGIAGWLVGAGLAWVTGGASLVAGGAAGATAGTAFGGC